MRQVPVLTFAALLAAGYGAAQTEVRRSGDKVDVKATAAAVSEVLDRLARETGMKVTYDGPPPRARVSLHLTAVTPSQAVLSVLEGQGLNYAMRMDPTGTRVETLLMVSSGSAAAPPASPARATTPRPIEREPEPAEEEEPAEAPPAPEEVKRPGFPFPGFPGPPTGPAVPLQLPTPPPPVGASPSAAQPQG